MSSTPPIEIAAPSPVSLGELQREQAAPGDGISFETTHGAVRVVSSVRDIPQAVLQNAFLGQSKDLRYYDIAARSLAGQFDHRYLLVTDRETGRTGVQPVFFVNQDVLEGLPAKIHATLAWPRKFFPGWLRMRMLMAGCSAGDGALDIDEPWFVEAVADAVDAYAKKTRASVVLYKDFPAKWRKSLAPLTEKGCRRVPSMPGCCIDFDFSTFEEYTKKVLSSNMRHKFNKLAKAEPVQMEVVTDVTPFADEIAALYEPTYAKSKMRFEHLTAEFFALAGRELADTARYFLWRVDGKLAAFSLCLIHGETIYNLNVGFDYAVSLDRQLYFVTFRDTIRWALAHGLKRFYTGQLSYDPKLRLRLRLDPLDLYARHTNRLINPVFKFALDFLQPARHDPVIKQFPNAAEL